MQVKYLYSSFKSARVKKLTNEYLFYLQLQSIQFPQNEMYKGSLIKEIQAHFNYSPASISIQLKKLVKAGFVDLYKHDSNKEWKYVIKSYRLVWNKLGFRFKQYVERYKFDLIDVENKSELKAQIFTLELQRNKQKQEFKLKTNLENKIKYHQDTIDKTKSSKIREKKQKALLHLNSIKTSLEKVNLGRCAKRPMENRISCKRASLIMGFKSTMTIVNLHKKAQIMTLLSVKKQTTLVAESISKIEYSINPQFEGCYWKFGRVFRNECNIYQFSNIRKSSSLQSTSSETL
jgi:predicted transcriptional regulator